MTNGYWSARTAYESLSAVEPSLAKGLLQSWWQMPTGDGCPFDYCKVEASAVNRIDDPVLQERGRSYGCLTQIKAGEDGCIAEYPIWEKLIQADPLLSGDVMELLLYIEEEDFTAFAQRWNRYIAWQNAMRKAWTSPEDDTPAWESEDD